MNFEEQTTHVVVKFIEKTKDGTENIDLVPISWIYFDNDELYCKYPTKKNEYRKLNEMCQSSSAYGISWKGYRISIIKEACNFDQGIRRMEKAFSDKVVQSSNFDENNSSDAEKEPSTLSKDNLKKSLTNIPSIGIQKFDLATREERGLKADELASDSSTSSKSSLSSLSTLKKRSFKKSGKHTLDFNYTSSSSSTFSTAPVKRQKKNTLSSLLTSSDKIAKQKYLKKIPTKLKYDKPSIDTIHSRSSKKLSSASSSGLNLKKALCPENKINNNCCPTCGCSCSTGGSQTSVIKSLIDSTRRSIEYRIKEEAKTTRAILSTHVNSISVEPFKLEETLNDLPKTDLESFQDFDNQLQNDLELKKKLKYFMVLNINRSAKISENLSAVIPTIMAKSVQMSYTAFGREMKGKKKLDFSSTQTYKYLFEVFTNTIPGINKKEFCSHLSRWFSGAHDREGGKKERIEKNMRVVE